MTDKIKRNLLKVGCVVVSMGGVAANAAPSQKITEKKELEFIKAPENHFSGNAQFALFPKIDNSKDSIAVVEFEAETITEEIIRQYYGILME